MRRGLPFSGFRNKITLIFILAALTVAVVVGLTVAVQNSDPIVYSSSRRPCVARVISQQDQRFTPNLAIDNAPEVIRRRQGGARRFSSAMPPPIQQSGESVE